MDENIVYEKFIKWLGSTWWELPESEHLLPMIKSNYTVEEAQFLTGLPFSAQPLEDIAAIKGMSPEKTTEKLAPLAQKGMVFKSVKNGVAWYRLNDSFLSHLRANLWPGVIDERLEKSIPLINKYFFDGFYDQYDDATHKGLRTLPIGKTIKDTRTVMPFEDVIKIIDSFEYYTVSHCPCRVRHNNDPDLHSCSHPEEVCLHFDDLGHYIVENGQGREITKEETFDILKMAADSGLVHGLSNWKENPDTICNCCSCCCMFLEGFHKMGHKKSLDTSNYLVKIDEQTCKACMLCIKRCPMDALQLKVNAKAENKLGKTAVLNPDLCIGCGVCAHKCPTDSMKLIQKEEITEPPGNVKEYMKHYMMDKKAAKEKRDS